MRFVEYKHSESRERKRKRKRAVDDESNFCFVSVNPLSSDANASNVPRAVKIEYNIENMKTVLVISRRVCTRNDNGKIPVAC